MILIECMSDKRVANFISEIQASCDSSMREVYMNLGGCFSFKKNKKVNLHSSVNGHVKEEVERMLFFFCGTRRSYTYKI